jgi:HAD superfamily phosphoserine phosphatase-like hydrolase
MTGTAFAFDLDGTITREEILPLIAAELGLEREMRVLTDLTLSGAIDFEDSFRLRCAVLRSVPVDDVRELVAQVQLASALEGFIADHVDRCFVVTGNLDVWVAPIVERLGCRAFTSTGVCRGGRLVEVAQVLTKDRAVAQLRTEFDRVVAVGDSVNDLPMFELADLRVAYGGVHDPAEALYQVADYVAYEEDTLCRLLSTLS